MGKFNRSIIEKRLPHSTTMCHILAKKHEAPACERDGNKVSYNLFNIDFHELPWQSMSSIVLSFDGFNKFRYMVVVVFSHSSQKNNFRFSFLLAHQTWELKSVMQKDSKSYRYIELTAAEPRQNAALISKTRWNLCWFIQFECWNGSFNFVIIGNFFTCISRSLFKFHCFFPEHLSQSVELTHVHIDGEKGNSPGWKEPSWELHERKFCSHNFSHIMISAECDELNTIFRTAEHNFESSRKTACMGS